MTNEARYVAWRARLQPIKRTDRAQRSEGSVDGRKTGSPRIYRARTKYAASQCGRRAGDPAPGRVGIATGRKGSRRFLASQFQFRVLRHAAGRETAAAERALAGGSEPREHPQRAGENGANGTRRSSETRKAPGRRGLERGPRRLVPDDFSSPPARPSISSDNVYLSALVVI